jgi:molecular chaperone GrpE
MPTRSRKPTDLPEPERPGKDGEEPIEILEVVGVDETTGTVKEKSAREEHASGRSRGRAHADTTSILAHELEEAKQDKDKYYDLLLRKQAEFDNFRKRMERERSEAGAAAVREVVKRFLPVLDNMERALRASEGSKDSLFKGIELVHQQFLDVLRKEGVVPIEALGTRFDPRLHEAVDVQDVAGFEPDVVLEEMQKGYTYNDRLLRPALVKVASGRGTERGPSADPQRHDEDAGEEP